MVIANSNTDPETSYDNLFPYDILYEWYSTIVNSDLVTVTKESYSSDIINTVLDFPSDKAVNTALEKVRIQHSINSAYSLISNGSSLFSYPQSALYQVTVTPTVNNAKKSLIEKTVVVLYKPIPDAQYAALMEFFKIVENRLKKGRVEIKYQLVESRPFVIGSNRMRTLVEYIKPYENRPSYQKIPILDTKKPSSIYPHQMTGGTGTNTYESRLPVDENDAIYSIVRDENGNIVYSPIDDEAIMTTTKRWRWFDHPDALDLDNINVRTIGYGHVIIKSERESGTIKVRTTIPTYEPYLTLEVKNIYTQGLRDEDIFDLLNLDVQKRVENVQKILGPERWNLLINGGTVNKMVYPPHPSWAAMLVNIHFNGGNGGIREWPQLLYAMGLITKPSNLYEGVDKNGKSISALYVKNNDGSYKYPSISSMFGELSYKPMSPLLLNSRTNISEISNQVNLKKLGTRNETLRELFLRPGFLSPGYTEIVDITKKPFSN